MLGRGIVAPPPLSSRTRGPQNTPVLRVLGWEPGRILDGGEGSAFSALAETSLDDPRSSWYFTNSTKWPSRASVAKTLGGL
jgi:hypothetical protein